MIEQLAIHRFRGIREGKLEDLGKVNVLIGPNNSGKTAILEMLYLTGVSGRSSRFKIETDALELIEIEYESAKGYAPMIADFMGYVPWSRIWLRHGQNDRWENSPAKLSHQNALRCNLKFLTNSQLLRIFSLIPPPSEELDYGGFTAEDSQTVASFVLPSEVELPLELLPPSLHSYLEGDSSATRFTFAWYPPFIHEIRQPGSAKAEYPLAVWASLGRHPRHVLLFDFHSAHGRFTSEFRNTAWKKIPDWYEKIAESLARIHPELASCRVEIAADDKASSHDGYVGYIRLPGSTPLAVDHYGDGTRHAFKVISGLIALKEMVSDDEPGLFLWEDPELFMHTEALGALLKEVMGIVRESPIQMFLCTQNKEVLNHMARLVGDEVIPPEEFRSFQLHLREGRLLVQPFVGETLGVWMVEYGMDPRVPDEEEE